MVLLKLNLVFIFVDGQPTSMNIKVLVFVLTRQVALLPLKILHILLFEPEFEVFDFGQFLLILANSLPHAIFFALDQEEFHLDSLLNVGFPKTHRFFFLENGLAVRISCLFEF